MNTFRLGSVLLFSVFSFYSSAETECANFDSNAIAFSEDTIITYDESFQLVDLRRMSNNRVAVIATKNNNEILDIYNCDGQKIHPRISTGGSFKFSQDNKLILVGEVNHFIALLDDSFGSLAYLANGWKQAGFTKDNSKAFVIYMIVKERVPHTRVAIIDDRGVIEFSDYSEASTHEVPLSDGSTQTLEVPKPDWPG